MSFSLHVGHDIVNVMLSSQRLGVGSLFIEPGSPWENGYIESFNGRLRAEFLNAEIFDTLREAKILIERWRREYNTIRPHSSLAYRPPAPAAVQPEGYGATPLHLPVDGEERKDDLNRKYGLRNCTSPCNFRY